MVGGKPGDNELSDILLHGLAPFGGGVDDEIRALLDRFPGARAEVNRAISGRAFPLDGISPGDLQRALRTELAAIRARWDNEQHE